jgi:hypothetical protein
MGHDRQISAVVPSQFDLDQSDPIIFNADWHVPLSKIDQL